MMTRRTFVSCGAAGLAGTFAQRRLRARAPADTGQRFELVQPELFALSGAQPNCWADFNNDGHLDLFVGFKDAVPNRLYRYDGVRFSEIAASLGLADLTDTRAAAWGDFDADGHLDLYVGFTRRSGAANRLYRNEGNGTRFTEIGRDLGIDVKGETRQVSWVDFDNDGRVDLFVAGYGRNFLFHNEGEGRFRDVAESMGLAGGDKATPSSWGDFDNDGRPDLYVSSYVDRPLNERDFLYRNDGSRFGNVMPDVIAAHGATHGVQWVDFDGDGALDLALANNNPKGGHYLFRNVLPADRRRRSIQVAVVDANGRHTRAGSEVRVYAAGTRRVLGARLVDTGGGYCSQSVAPVHFGLPSEGKVDVEVTAMTRTGRRITRVSGVDPNKLPKRVLVVKAGAPVTAAQDR